MARIVTVKMVITFTPNMMDVVEFLDMTEEEIEEYVKSDEYLDSVLEGMDNIGDVFRIVEFSDVEDEEDAEEI